MEKRKDIQIKDQSITKDEVGYPLFKLGRLSLAHSVERRLINLSYT